MKRCAKILCSLLGVVLAVPGYGTVEQGKTFLFELDYRGTASYILGSVHMLKKEHYPLPAVITDAFQQSEVLGVEVDMLNIDQFELQSKMMKIGRFEEPATLKDHIPEDLYDQTRTLLDEFGLAMDFFNQFKPWFVAVSLQGFQLVKLGFNPQLGVDMVFLKRARERDMPVVELEGPMFQVNLLDGFTEEEQLDFLKSTVLEAEKMPVIIDEIITAWQHGDTRALQDLFTQGYEEVEGGDRLKEKFIDDRNRRMTEKILAWIQDGRSYFIVVGAGHLVGEEGIIRLLSDAGHPCAQR